MTGLLFVFVHNLIIGSIGTNVLPSNSTTGGECHHGSGIGHRITVLARLPACSSAVILALVYGGGERRTNLNMA